MSKCDLSIQFSRVDRTWRTGETIEGQIVVRANKDVVCNPLTIVLLWQTHGRGNISKKKLDTQTQANQEWRSGRNYTYPFSFILPDGPVSYHGHHLNIDYYIRVRADIPWAIDPKLNEDFLVLPGKSQTTVSQSESTAPHLQKIGKILTSSVVIILAMIMGGFALGEGLDPLLTRSLVVVVIGLGLALAMRKSLAEKRLGAVELDLASTMLHPEEMVPLTLRLKPRKDTSLNRITYELIGKEICISGSGTNKTTHTHVIEKRETESAAGQRLQSGLPLTLKTLIQVPDTRAYSFKSDDGQNSVVWKLKVHIDIPQWPDWVEELPVTVVPSANSYGPS